MQNIRVQFTVPDVERLVNLDVMVNGEKRHIKFRVETFDWNEYEPNTANAVAHLRQQISDYDSNWELYHIGTPSKGMIPITFKHKALN